MSIDDKQPVAIIPAAAQLPAAAQEESTLMNLIAKMASDPAADVPKLERLIALRNDEMARRAKAAYDVAFAEMKPHLPKVIKRHENTQTNSKYAKLGDINVEIDPILGKYGFGSSMKIMGQSKEDVTVMIRVTHAAGHTEETTIIMPLDNKGPNGTVNKTGPHALLSAIEYAKRGGLSALLNVSTGDDKDGNQEQEHISVEQAVDLDTRLRKLGDDALPRFLKWAKLEKLIDLTTKNYPKALKALEQQETDAKKVKS